MPENTAGARKSLLSRKNLDMALLGGGTIALLAGFKVAGLTLVGLGAVDLERSWRARHTDWNGTFADRWQRAVALYEATHQEPTNRRLHVVGIPMIVGGVAGLLVFRPFGPLWLTAAGAFTAGWVLNFIGHGVYEKNAPAFADDPLAFIAGPAWDMRQLFGGGPARGGAAE